MSADNPDRVRSLITPGTGHTFLQGSTDLEVEGISVLEWVTAMLEDSEDWISVQEI